MRKALFLAVPWLLVFVVTTTADIPKLINYQGMLTSPDGEPLNGYFDLTFAIYNAPTDGQLRWEETHPGVLATSGLFNVILGTETPGGINLDFSEEYWLEIQVGVEPMLERLKFTSVGYAFRARAADTASYAIEAVSAETDSDWTISGDHMYSSLSGNVGIGSTNPTLGKLEVLAFSGPGVYASASGAAGVLGFSPDGQGVLGLSTTGHAGYFLGKVHVSDTVGIGTENPAAKLDVSGDVNVDSAYKIGGNTVLAAPDTQNTLVGVGAGLSNTGENGTFVGWYAGYQNQGDINTFIGHLCGRDNTAGEYNTFVGSGAGMNNSSGNYNTFLGERCGRDNTTGHFNTCVGQHAGGRNIEGSSNTFLGTQTAYSCTAGSGNVFIGYRAGWYETGSNKLFIANGEDTSDVLIYGDFETGNIGLGTTNPIRRVHIVGDNPRILIEATSISPEVNFKNTGDPDSRIWALYKNGATHDFRFYQNGADRVTIQNATGNVGIGATDPGQKLDVNGIARIRSWGVTPTYDVQVNNDGDLCRVSSSKRYKKNIRGLESDLVKILNLEPVSFEWKTTSEKDVGLIAEDVHQLIPELVGYDKEGRPDAVRYELLSLYVLEIVKQQQQAIKELKSENQELKHTIEALRGE